MSAKWQDRIDSPPGRQSGSGLRQCILLDLRRVIHDFVVLQSSRFEDFMAVAKRHDLELLHYACSAPPSGRQDFMDMLFRAILTHLDQACDQPKLAGVMFLIYYFYWTQPTSGPSRSKATIDDDTPHQFSHRWPVKVSPEKWSVLRKIYQNALLLGLEDVAMAFEELNRDHAWNLTVEGNDASAAWINSTGAGGEPSAATRPTSSSSIKQDLNATRQSLESEHLYKDILSAQAIDAISKAQRQYEYCKFAAVPELAGRNTENAPSFALELDKISSEYTNIRHLKQCRIERMAASRTKSTPQAAAAAAKSSARSKLRSNVVSVMPANKKSLSHSHAGSGRTARPMSAPPTTMEAISAARTIGLSPLVSMRDGPIDDTTFIFSNALNMPQIIWTPNRTAAIDGRPNTPLSTTSNEEHGDKDMPSTKISPPPPP